MIDHRAMTRELTAKLSLDELKALVKATSRPITEQQLRRAVDSIVKSVSTTHNGERRHE